MAASLNFVGTGTTVTWGTNTISSPTGAGVIISASLRKSGETIPILNNLGAPDGMVIVQGITEASLEAYVNGTLPVVGVIANVAGTNVYIESVSQSWEQKGISRVSMSGKALP